MTLGPVQFMAIGFGAEAEFKGEILDELDRLTDRGLIRVLDIGLIRKTEAGDILHIQASGLTAEEVENLGGIVKNCSAHRLASKLSSRPLTWPKPRCWLNWKSVWLLMTWTALWLNLSQGNPWASCSSNMCGPSASVRLLA